MCEELIKLSGPLIVRVGVNSFVKRSVYNIAPLVIGMLVNGIVGTDYPVREIVT